MSKANEPAFPVMETFEKFDDDLGKYVEYQLPSGGLTKREYFAAKAMQGILRIRDRHIENNMKDDALLAVDYADSLLSALTQEEKSINKEMLEALKNLLDSECRANQCFRNKHTEGCDVDKYQDLISRAEGVE